MRRYTLSMLIFQTIIFRQAYTVTKVRDIVPLITNLKLSFPEEMKV